MNLFGDDELSPILKRIGEAFFRWDFDENHQQAPILLLLSVH
jgi:hypothetical protein